MIEGVDYDDMYRMVEDEFLAVAKDFTRHLHAAEYQRLKGLAKSQNAETIQNISRPVTGKMTGPVKRRHAALNTASRQRNGIADFLDKRATGNASKNHDEKQSSRRPATSLQGLMDSPRKQNVPLSLMPGSRPGSRHREAVDASPSRRRSSGFDSHRTGRNNSTETAARRDGAVSTRLNRESSTESEEDDDLDGQPDWPPTRNARRPEPTARPPIPQQSSSRPPASAESRPHNAETPIVRKVATERQGLRDVAPLSEPADLPPNNADEDVFAGLQARRAERKRRRETKAQESTTKTSETQAAALNSIPFI